MPLREVVERLTNAGLDLSLGITRLQGGSALLAKNVEITPDGAVSKRKGFLRAQELSMLGAVVSHYSFSGVFVSVDSLGSIDAD